jgi:tellurite resistance protein
MSGIFECLKRNYQSLMERQSNRPFLKEVMAACTMVAKAEGTISFAEQVRLDQIVNLMAASSFCPTRRHKYL